MNTQQQQQTATFELSNLDALVDELMNSESQTLQQRISDNVIDLFNYMKHDETKATNRKTGTALLSNKISNLSIVDIDINKELNEDEKCKVRKSIMQKLSEDDVIVKTASGGLHIYCNTDLFYVSKNRLVKCFKSDKFDVDLFSSVEPDKRSLVVLPNSRVRVNHGGAITSYEFVQGGYESIISRTLAQVLNDLNIKIKDKQPKEIESIIIKNKDNVIDEKLAQALVDGIADFEVHNDGGNQPINKEITLFTLFQAINSLPSEQFINEGYENVYNFCKLTDNAKMNFENARARYSHLSTSPFVLAKILKLYQSEYYNEYVKPLLTHDFEMETIDFQDSFSITDIRAKAEAFKYHSLNEVAVDLSKVIRFVDDGIVYYIQKVYDVHDKMYKLKYVMDKDMNKSLKLIKLWKGDEGGSVTAFDALQKFMSKFAIKGVRFNSDEENVFTTFQGFKYNVLDKVNDEMIVPFLKLVKEGICDNNDEVYEYVISWIARLIQNPGIKNETAIVLKGLQGTGKNTFTEAICELLSGYSAPNVTEISELTGQFNSVVENKMLIILNELKNCGEDRMANFNSLKSIITDKTIRINEKNQPRRRAENIANFIFCTNNAFPVKIEVGDRRYVVLHVNGKFKSNFDFFNNLYNSFNKEFYDNLLTYFMKRDLSEFNVRLIPSTEAKEDLIDASKTPIDQWICDHYNELVNEGIQCTDASNGRPQEMKLKAFQLAIKDKCEKKQKRVGSSRQWFYCLKDECKSLYKQTVYDDDENEEFDPDSIPVKISV